MSLEGSETLVIKHKQIPSELAEHRALRHSHAYLVVQIPCVRLPRSLFPSLLMIFLFFLCVNPAGLAEHHPSTMPQNHRSRAETLEGHHQEGREQASGEADAGCLNNKVCMRVPEGPVLDYTRFSRAWIFLIFPEGNRCDQRKTGTNKNTLRQSRKTFKKPCGQ